MVKDTKEAPFKPMDIRSYFGSRTPTQAAVGGSTEDTMRVHDANQAEIPHQQRFSNLEPKQKRRKSSVDGHVAPKGWNQDGIQQDIQQDIQQVTRHLMDGIITPSAGVRTLQCGGQSHDLMNHDDGDVQHGKTVARKAPISWDQVAKEDFEHLASTIKDVCSKAGMKGMDSFQSQLAACSGVLKTHPAMCKMFDLTGEPIQAREASRKVFEEAGIGSWEDDLNFSYDWQEFYLQELRKDPEGNAKEIYNITGEEPLSDALQDPAMALIALLAAEFDDGIYGLYDSFSRAVENCQGDDVSKFLKNCMDQVLSKVRDGNQWDIVAFREQYCDIPSGYSDIFPETIYLLEYVSEGLCMSLERIVLALVFAGNDQVKYTHMNYRLIFCSHVILPIKCETSEGVTYQYALHEDFLFGRVSLGDRNDNFVYASMEGRSVTTWAASVFSKTASNELLSVKFTMDDGRVRRFGQHRVMAMAKYQLDTSTLESLYYSHGLTVDHLTKLTSSGQATLLMVSDWYQQANNQRPRTRGLFQGQALAPISHKFEDLDENKQNIALECQNLGIVEQSLPRVRLQEGYGKAIYGMNCKGVDHGSPLPLSNGFEDLDENKRRIALSCKDPCMIKYGLPMVRLEEGYHKAIYDMGRRGGDHTPHETWAKLVVDYNVLYFEHEQCIWKKNTKGIDSWIFLENLMKTTRRTGYRRIKIANVDTVVSCSIAYTKLYAAVCFHQYQVSEEFLHHYQLEDIARKEHDGVKLKVAWKSQERGGAVHRLVTDHISMDTRDNRSTNLRMVDSRENVILARGKPCKAIISRFDDADDSLPEVITVTKRSIAELAESLPDVMDMMKYPDIYQRYDRMTVCRYISEESSFPDLDKIVFRLLGDKEEDTDTDFDIDTDINSEFQQSSMFWYVAVYQNRLNNCEEKCVYRGKDNLIRDVILKLALDQPIEYLKDNIFHTKELFNNDKEHRRLVIKKLMEKTSNHRGESDLDLIDLYSSHRTGKTYCQYYADIPNVGQYDKLKGHDDVIKALKLSPEIAQFVQELYTSSTGDMAQVLVDIENGWRSMVSGYFKIGRNSMLAKQFPNLVLKPMDAPRVCSERNRGKGKKLLVKFEDDAIEHLTVSEICNILEERNKGKKFANGTVRSWVRNAISIGIHADSHLRNVGIVSISDPLPENKSKSNEKRKEKKSEKSKCKYIYALANKEKLLKQSSDDLLDKYTLSRDKSLPGCMNDVKNAQVLEIVNKRLEMSNDTKKYKYESLQAALHEDDLVCLKLLGYKATDKSLENFMTHAMGMDKTIVTDILKSFNKGDYPSTKLPDWCHLIFTADTIAAMSIVKLTQSRHRAFVISIENMLEGDQDVAKIIKDVVIRDKICGTSENSSIAVPDTHKIVKENRDWVETSTPGHSTRSAWNNIIDCVWADFELVGKKIPFHASNGEIKWNKCMAEKVGNRKETTLYLRYGSEIPITAEEIPFAYVFLTEGRLKSPGDIKKNAPQARKEEDEKKKESSFLVIVGQHQKKK